MRAPVKIALLVGGIYLAYRLVTKKVTQWKEQLSVSLNAIGIPAIRSGALTLPIALNIFNPTPFAIPVTNVQGIIYSRNNGQLIPIGKINPTGQFSLAPGQNVKPFFPALDVKASAMGIDFTNRAFMADISVNVMGKIINQKIEKVV